SKSNVRLARQVRMGPCDRECATALDANTPAYNGGHAAPRLSNRGRVARDGVDRAGGGSPGRPGPGCGANRCGAATTAGWVRARWADGDRARPRGVRVRTPPRGDARLAAGDADRESGSADRLGAGGCAAATGTCGLCRCDEVADD